LFGQKLPFGHGLHSLLPKPEYVPAGHSVVLFATQLKFPGRNVQENQTSTVSMTSVLTWIDMQCFTCSGGE